MSIETCNSTIVGTVHKPAQAYRSRLSDLLNQKDANFLSVTDAAVYRQDDLAEPAYSTAYLAVNLSSIQMVRPLEG
ncbi:MAG: DUF6812 domain-containing protein [Thermoleophilia bacterium]